MREHPFLAVVGGVTLLAGGTLVGIGVGVYAGAIAEGSGSTILTALAAEFGATHSGVLIAANGAMVSTAGGALISQSTC